MYTHDSLRRMNLVREAVLKNAYLIYLEQAIKEDQHASSLYWLERARSHGASQKDISEILKNAYTV